MLLFLVAKNHDTNNYNNKTPECQGFATDGKRREKWNNLRPANELWTLAGLKEFLNGGRYWTRTSDPYNVSTEAKNRKPFNTKTCADSKKPLSVNLTVSHGKPDRADGDISALALPADLTAIALAWSSVPEPIKAAVKAVLDPYMLRNQGGSE
jgi:hypothetical protein